MSFAVLLSLFPLSFIVNIHFCIFELPESFFKSIAPFSLINKSIIYNDSLTVSLIIQIISFIIILSF